MKDILSLVFTLIFLFTITYTTIQYGDGWRVTIDNEDKGSNVEIKKKGMLAIRSIPDGAQVYINDNQTAITATNDTISSITPGEHRIKVVKEGFEVWEKKLNVYSEAVTDITAVLVLKNPKLEPYTNLRISTFEVSNDRNKIAFINNDEEDPGIWELTLTNSPINIFNTNKRILAADTRSYRPSLGEKLIWSPDDDELAVMLNDQGYLVYDTRSQAAASAPIRITSNLNEIRTTWDGSLYESNIKTVIEIIKTQIEGADIIDIAKTDKAIWSPDFEKFFYLENAENSTEKNVIVYNSESPLPVDEKRLTTPLKIKTPENTSIFWYSDSYHLIISELLDQESMIYTISMIRIDGSNKVQVYTGRLASPNVVPTPNGDKIIVLTSLKEDAPKNLYGIGIR